MTDTPSFVAYRHVKNGIEVFRLDWANGKRMPGEMFPFDGPADTGPALLDRAMPNTGNRDRRIAFDEGLGNVSTSFFETAVLDWSQEAICRLITGGSGLVPGGALYLKDIDQNHRIAIQELDGKDIRVHLVRLMRWQRERITGVEAISFIEEKSLDRALIGWSRVEAMRMEGDVAGTEQAVWRIFDDAINPQLRNIVVDSPSDLKAMAAAGRLPFHDDDDDDDDALFLPIDGGTVIEYPNGGSREELETIFRALYLRYPPAKKPAAGKVWAVTFCAALSPEAYAAGDYEIIGPNNQSLKHVVAFLLHYVAPVFWPIGYDISVNDDGCPLLASSYALEAHNDDLYVHEDATGHEALDADEVLKNWLVSRAGKSPEEARSILDKVQA
jgi:hypothetical protein